MKSKKIKTKRKTDLTLWVAGAALKVKSRPSDRAGHLASESHTGPVVVMLMASCSSALHTCSFSIT